MKIYTRKGKRNYKELKMINELTDALAKKSAEDQSKIIPATNENELQAMYNKYVVQDVDYTETKTTESKTKQPEMAKKKTADIEDVEFEEKVIDNKSAMPSVNDSDDSDNRFVDPFNRENPIVREYVMGKDALGRERVSSEGAKTTFDEPTSFKEAFEIPSYDEDGKEEKSEPTKKPQPKAEKREKYEKPEPLNPSFDEMSNGKKKRSSKKFAKYIVEAVCMLSQKGLVWYANKDISESKLVEYELNGEMDLSLLVSLEDGQQVTIKEFFANQCIAAEQLTTIDETQKSDLVDALTEVMLEKGIAPTPTQELMMIAFSVFGGQAISIMALKNQTNSLLAQLRTNNDPNTQRQVYNEPQPQAQAQEEVEPEPIQAEQVSPNQTNFDDIDSAINDYAETEVEQVVETIE
jgi:hypothetical protein